MPPPRTAVRGARVRPFYQRYIGYRVGTKFQRLPLLHVRLRGEFDSFTTIALIDSGATVTFIPPELVEAIGLRFLRRDVSAFGAGGEFLNDICEFDLDVIVKGDVVRRIRGAAYVPKDRGRVPYVVLGRDYLFQTYDITFKEQQKKVSLLPASGPSSR